VVAPANTCPEASAMTPETDTSNGRHSHAGSSVGNPPRGHPHTRPGPVTALCRAANQLRQYLDHTVLHPVGLNWTSFDVLQLAVASGEVDSRTAAATVGVSKATITQVVRALARRNLLRRDVGGDDQRRVLLRPTAAGWHLIRDIRGQIAAVENDLLHHGVPDITIATTAVVHAVAAPDTGPESTTTPRHHSPSGEDRS
jgi:DNA-binding MarR family transcriptional regulator